MKKIVQISRDITFNENELVNRINHYRPIISNSSQHTTLVGATDPDTESNPDLPEGDGSWVVINPRKRKSKQPE